MRTDLLDYGSFMHGFLMAIALPLLGGAPTAPATSVGQKLVDEAALILQARCGSCHAGDEASGDLRLDTHAGVMRGGERGPAVIPGDPTASLLLRKVLRRDRPAMPPKKRLPASEIQILRSWIRAGAPP
jgi:mono/diheme cytochrome c family protein